MEDNTITHIEIPAPDLQSAVDFYSTVFNWNIEISQPSVYAFFRIGQTQTGGGLDAGLSVAGEKQGSQIVVDVESVDQSLKKIESAGGAIILPGTEIEGGHGYYAIFRDPNGNYLQIHSRKP